MTDDDQERVAIKLILAHDVYPDTPAGKQRAEDDARAEGAESKRRAEKSHGYEQRRLL
jgi:hypothetical protein